MERGERERILRQGVVLPETPRERRQREALVEDLRPSPLRGRPLSLRLRNFRPAADAYLAALGGPLPYMQRLRAIDEGIDALEGELERACLETARAHERDGFAARWQAHVEAVVAGAAVAEVNDLIERHNRWYPVESRLPMDPLRGDYALVLGRDYRLAPIDVAWVLARFPPDQAAARAA
jgi:hypothetical protein